MKWCFFLMFLCLLISCGNDESRQVEKNILFSKDENLFYYADNVWQIKPVSVPNSQNRFHMSRTEALNVCPENYHLPDQFEWNDFIKAAREIETELNSDDEFFYSRNFWTSTVVKNSKDERDYKVVVASFQKGLQKAANTSYSFVLCKRNKVAEYQNNNENSFYGTANLKLNEPSCKNNLFYLNYFDKKLLKCDNSVLAIYKEDFVFSSDSVNLALDSAIPNLYFLPDCSPGLYNKIFMDNDERRVFRCQNGGWFSLGYQKIPDINKGVFYDTLSNEWYKTVKIGNQIWMAENLRKNVPNSVCYNDEEEKCKKYGRLYLSYEDGLCPVGWTLPSEDDWKNLMTSFNNNGSFLRSTDDWFFDFKNENDVGFTAYPAGWYKHENYYENPMFVDFSVGVAWLASKNGNSKTVYFDGEKFEYKPCRYKSKYYIRCKKNNEIRK